MSEAWIKTILSQGFESLSVVVEEIKCLSPGAGGSSFDNITYRFLGEVGGEGRGVEFYIALCLRLGLAVFLTLRIIYLYIHIWLYYISLFPLFLPSLLDTWSVLVLVT